MKNKLLVPDIGDFEKVEIIEILVKIGDSIKKNDPSILNCGIESGSQVSKVAHMGNVAFRSGSKIKWNEEKNNFDNSSANNLIEPKYNNGWNLPSL